MEHEHEHSSTGLKSLVLQPAMLQALIAAHSEREEMAGFMLPVTRDCLKGLEEEIEATRAELGVQLIEVELGFNGSYTGVLDTAEDRPSYPTAVELDVLQLREDEASLSFPGDLTAQSMQVSQWLRSRARVATALSHASDGKDAIDLLTRSGAIHIAATQIMADPDWEGHADRRAVFEATLLVRAASEHSVDMEVHAFIQDNKLVACEQSHCHWVSPGLLFGNKQAFAVAIERVASETGLLERDCVLDVGLDYARDGMVARVLRVRNGACENVGQGLWSEPPSVPLGDSTCEIRLVDSEERIRHCLRVEEEEEEAVEDVCDAPNVNDDECAYSDSDDDAPMPGNY